MKILHYSLGFPPYRTGGLTKFCIDLMEQQVKEGHEVSLLWPGKINLFGRKTKIKKNKSINGVGNYEVINPIPVPFDEGIKGFDVFTSLGDARTYKMLIDNIKPDVIHIHTLMGLHKVFLDVAKKKKVKLVFTTHDFFPICPKVTMFRHGQICSCIDSCKECGECNNSALSIRKMQILQSPMYRMFKDLKFVKKLRKQHRDYYLSEVNTKSNKVVGNIEDYKKLRNYYYSMLKLMDVIHYNSTLSKKVYEKIFTFPCSTVINISHANIVDNRRKKNFDSALLRIRYLGPQSGAKGYFLLKAALDGLWKKWQGFRLDVHFTPSEKPPYMECHDKYSYNQLEAVFEDTDVLICPSIWYETFGYTVLEALSFGVPVVISETVGAKDILGDGVGIIINDISPEKLINVIKCLTSEKLREMNRSILENQRIITLKEISKKILNECYMGD